MLRSSFEGSEGKGAAANYSEMSGIISMAVMQIFYAIFPMPEHMETPKP